LGNDGNFYGTAIAGGIGGYGGIFKVTPTGVTTFPYTFSGGNDGSGPENIVLGSDGTLFGTTSSGGVNGLGTVFRY